MSTLTEFRLRTHKTRTLRNEIPAYRSIARPHRAAHLLQKHTAAAMLPLRDFRRRRRRPFAPLGQPLIFFWLAALLARSCAQPHAREDHAQHIMNQARANQKASRPVCNSRVGRGEPSTPRAVKGVRGPHARYERRRTKQQREWQRRKHEEGKKATKADNLKAQRQARKDLLKRKRDLAKRKKERDRRKRSVSSAYGEL